VKGKNGEKSEGKKWAEKSEGKKLRTKMG